MGDGSLERGVASLDIASRSGRVVVRAGPVAEPQVLHGGAVIGPDGVVRSEGTGRVEIACPEGTDVIIGSGSGRVECHGPLGRVAVTGLSGHITIEAARAIEVRSTSGGVTVGSCDETCRVTATSGRVEIGSAGAIDVTLASGRLEAAAVGGALVRGGSGRVEVGLVRAGSVDVSTLSGSVSIKVAPGVHPGLALRSRSGRVRAAFEPGPDGHVEVETSSGSIKVTRG